MGRHVGLFHIRRAGISFFILQFGTFPFTEKSGLTPPFLVFIDKPIKFH